MSYYHLFISRLWLSSVPYLYFLTLINLRSISVRRSWGLRMLGRVLRRRGRGRRRWRRGRRSRRSRGRRTRRRWRPCRTGSLRTGRSPLKFKQWADSIDMKNILPETLFLRCLMSAIEAPYLSHLYKRWRLDLCMVSHVNQESRVETDHFHININLLKNCHKNHIQTKIFCLTAV